VRAAPFPFTLRRDGTCGARRLTRRVLNGVIYGRMSGLHLWTRSLIRLRAALTKRVS